MALRAGAPTKILHIANGILWWCPACSQPHGGVGFTLVGHEDVRPSAIVDSKDRRCHSTVVRGLIEYHADCTHELKGQKIPLVPF
jgi:hypothetical protein